MLNGFSASKSEDMDEISSRLWKSITPAMKMNPVSSFLRFHPAYTFVFLHILLPRFPECREVARHGFLDFCEKRKSISCARAGLAPKLSLYSVCG